MSSADRERAIRGWEMEMQDTAAMQPAASQGLTRRQLLAPWLSGWRPPWDEWKREMKGSFMPQRNDASRCEEISYQRACVTCGNYATHRPACTAGVFCGEHCPSCNALPEPAADLLTMRRHWPFDGC